MKDLPCVFSLLLALHAGAGVTSSARQHVPGTAFGIAPFGVRTVSEDGTARGLRWAQPRKVRRVVVVFPDG